MKSPRRLKVGDRIGFVNVMAWTSLLLALSCAGSRSVCSEKRTTTVALSSSTDAAQCSQALPAGVTFGSHEGPISEPGTGTSAPWEDFGPSTAPHRAETRPSTSGAPVATEQTETHPVVPTYRLRTRFAEKTVEALISNSALVRSFLSVFPNSEVGVLSWIGPNGEKRLNMRTIAHARYEITLQLEFKKNRGDDPEPTGKFSFAISERAKVTVDGNGREIYIEYNWNSGIPPHFDEDAWWRFARGSRDWTALGVQELNKLPPPTIRGE